MSHEDKLIAKCYECNACRWNEALEIYTCKADITHECIEQGNVYTKEVIPQ